MFLIFDTETTGLPERWNAPITDTDNWPRAVQIAWQLHDAVGNLIEQQNFLITPDGFSIPYDAERIHGISTGLANDQGVYLKEVLEKFNLAIQQSKYIVGHNVNFDNQIIGCEFHRLQIETKLNKLPVLDTCTETTAFLCKMPGGKGGKFKLPTLTELYQFLFQEKFKEAHNASADVEATTRCFFELVRKRVYTAQQLAVTANYFDDFSTHNPQTIPPIGLKHVNLKKASEKIKKRLEQKTVSKISTAELQKNLEVLAKVPFVHLHNHSQFSILQSTVSIPDLIQLTASYQMPAVALTDHANMMGAFHFVKSVNQYNRDLACRKKEAAEKGEILEEQNIKPIVGCEFFVCKDHLNKSYKDNGYQIVMLAKNKNGYHNLAKMSSIGYTKGFYYVPRIDKKIIEQYKEDILVLTGNLYGEIPSKILHKGTKEAEEALVWWKDTFGENLYIEIMNHGREEEDRVNTVLVDLAKKHQVRLVATNNTYYGNKEDAEAHDILLCLKNGEKQSTPIGRGRGKRPGLLPNREFYFKSQEEMKKLFQDIPEAITNISEIIDQIEPFELARDILLPAFDIPKQFQFPEDLTDGGKRGENALLRHLTYEGAKKRYGEITPLIKERLDFELAVIEKTGYPGYFLIIEDLIREARNMGVSVGPGRGSAAGSAVAYCLKITNLDPIEYDLLFERFLNPDRISMPDIDIDFDDEGRGRVMEYVINKYGSNQVAQIITYGTMAAKSSIRDTARVLDLPLHKADRIAKLIPNTKLAKIFNKTQAELKEKFRLEEVEQIQELIRIAKGEDLEAQTINKAKTLEGSVRNTGIHACGVIITPDDITNFVPIALAKDSSMYCTQFDNSVVESAGLLKMDFLGLKTLTLIKDTVKIVRAKYGISLDPENFPLEDEKTYQLFQKGETVGIFQYESVGMQKHMKSLKPTVFADLIAMNALYRPGPMEYIPSFIRRKHGEEEIVYDLEDCEEYLKETYGITVYQEQVMLLSQKIANFTKGEADVLRKAMGKKIFSLLKELKPKFLDGGESNGHDRKKLEKIWKDWEAFAAYAFNKSHSTCYARIAYQTAYLKAHYPAEYMAAVLSNNMNDIKTVTFFMEECKRMKLKVLGPCINESYYKFSVNEQGVIRFGMGAVKGVGKAAVETIVKDRKKNGKYQSVFDLVKRIKSKAVNKKALESLALSGGFDTFSEIHRAQYFQDIGGGTLFLEKILRLASKLQQTENSEQMNLFGESNKTHIEIPIAPICEKWNIVEKLKKEKEVIGIYISGHPLDNFKIEMTNFCNSDISYFSNLATYVHKKLSFAGIISDVQHRISKNGKGWALFTVEDYVGSFEFKIFGEEYNTYKKSLQINSFIYAMVYIKPYWNKDNSNPEKDYRMQFVEIQPLEDILEKQTKKITILVDAHHFEKKQLDFISQLFLKNQGKHPLYFNVYEEQEKTNLNLYSRNCKINASKEQLEQLANEGISYKIN